MTDSLRFTFDLKNYKFIIMKTKVFFVAALVGLGSIANAQTTQVTNDKGSVVTPEAGDWAIGFNAAPMFDYVGNMFNGSTSNSLSTQFIDANNAIYGKMFVDENTAYRASIRIGTGSTTIGSVYGGMNGDSLTNTAKYSGSAIVLGGGIEKRRGHGRLQGYYGGELQISLGGSQSTENYEYAVTADTANFNAGVLVDEFGDPSLSRTDSKKYGTTFGLGLRGFIGAEYFVLPKISIAAEYGWGLGFSSTGAAETVTTTLDPTDNTTEQTTVLGGKSSSFNIDTDNLSGAIRVMFHF